MKKLLFVLVIILLYSCSTQSRVEKYLAQAREYSEQNEHFKALELLNKAIELAPNDTAALSSRAQAYQYVGNLYAALKDMNALIVLYPDTLDYQFGKGCVLLSMHNYQESINIFNQLIRKDSCNANFYAQRGACYFQSKEHIRAVSDFQSALNLDHNYYFPAMLGALTHIQGNFQQAIDYSTLTLKLNPFFADAYSQRGMSKTRLFDYSGALDDYNTAIALDSNRANYYCNRGLTYLDMKNTNRALEDFNKALIVDSTFAEAYYSRALLKMDKGDDRNALKDFEQFYSYDSSYVPAIYNIVLGKNYLKEFDEALFYAKKLVELSPKKAEYYLLLGTIKFQKLNNTLMITQANAINFQDKLNDIITDISKAIRLDPSNAELYMSRGFIKYLLKDQTTCDDVQEALDLGIDKTALNPKVRSYCPDLFK